ncbi:helix-turn-helix transcriptional regulator [Actinophytocola oryzae]|uniref:Putative DNA-binding transcriptional regulator YafY n=1 Tax=Actinophytocola oryzae TaxID=502181 RepID=A0A4R7UXY2_9PSEU|nr:WYL domain-containing protein [Actinophytocola oryzae]TDV41709.1 putative DNA-binding transcriptional regulator YafY [Actinophytocola oryzae]
MRAERLVALLFLLQQRQRATAAELAAALEVSERTVYRDVEALSSAGVPLWTEQGRAGGIRLLEGWRSRLDGLTGREAAAIFAIGVPELLAELGLGSSLVAARAKVMAGLPTELRDYAARIADRFHLDAPGWFQEVESTSQLTVVADAVASSKRLRVEYQRGATTVSRELAPLGLVVKAGVWYLVAQIDADIRTYRVAKIVSADVLPETFDRPKDFALTEWWAQASTKFERSLLRETVRLRLSQRGMKSLRAVTDPDTAAMAIATAGPPDEEGWREVTLEVESLPVATTQLLALGVNVEVVAPEALRTTLAELGLAIAARNAPVSDRHKGDVPPTSA